MFIFSFLLLLAGAGVLMAIADPALSRCWHKRCPEEDPEQERGRAGNWDVFVSALIVAVVVAGVAGLSMASTVGNYAIIGLAILGLGALAIRLFGRTPKRLGMSLGVYAVFSWLVVAAQFAFNASSEDYSPTTLTLHNGLICSVSHVSSFGEDTTTSIFRRAAMIDWRVASDSTGKSNLTDAESCAQLVRYARL